MVDVKSYAPDAVRALTQFGPFVDVVISVHRRDATAAAAAGRPVPEPVGGRAIIDTGSSTTAITFETAARLKLDPVGRMQVGTGTDVVRAPTFAVSITFPAHSITLDFERAPGLPVGQQGNIAIIGRDVLGRALFSYDGPKGTTSLEFRDLPNDTP
jgi:hypothetical protein